MTPEATPCGVAQLICLFCFICLLVLFCLRALRDKVRDQGLLRAVQHLRFFFRRNSELVIESHTSLNQTKQFILQDPRGRKRPRGSFTALDRAMHYQWPCPLLTALLLAAPAGGAWNIILDSRAAFKERVHVQCTRASDSQMRVADRHGARVPGCEGARAARVARVALVAL